MSLPATESFTGTDGTSPPNSNWTNQDIGIQIKSNAAASATNGSYGFAYWNADTFNNDQYSQCVLVNAHESGPCVRMSGTNNAYSFHTRASGGGTTKLFARLSGSFNLLTDFGSIAWVAGDVAKISVTGTTITCYRNGVSIGTGTDSNLTSGSAGVLALENVADVDTWEGGNVGGGGFTPLFRKTLSGIGSHVGGRETHGW